MINFDLFSKLVSILAIFALISILFNLISIHAFQDFIFIKNNSLEIVELLILIGFIIILMFIIISILWLVDKAVIEDKIEWNDSFTVLLGVVCFIALFAQKVMVDEIAREMKLGWETVGELIILSLLLVIQLVYSIIIFKKTKTT